MGLTEEQKQRARETRRRNQQRREEIAATRAAEREAQIMALRRVRDDPDSSSGDVLRAVELLAQIENR